MFWGTIGYISSTLLVQKMIQEDNNNDKSGHGILGIFAILVFSHSAFATNLVCCKVNISF